jgi:hypothetical protein
MVETEGERIHQPWDDALQSLVRANPEAFIRLALEHARFYSPSPKVGRAVRLSKPCLLVLKRRVATIC